MRKDIPFSLGTSRLFAAIFIGFFFSCLSADKIFAFSSFAGAESKGPAQGMRVERLVALDVSNEIGRESIKKLEFVTNTFFNYRRKMIKKPLGLLFKDVDKIKKKYNLNINERPQKLNPLIYYKLSNELNELG